MSKAKMKVAMKPYYHDYPLFRGNPMFGKVRNNIMVYDKNLELNDCAVNAISIALDFKYEFVHKKLKAIVKKKLQNNPHNYDYKPDPMHGVSEDVVYDFLKEQCWKAYRLYKPVSLRKLSIRNHPTILAAVKGHLSVIRNANIYDSYDSGRQRVKVIYLKR